MLIGLGGLALSGSVFGVFGGVLCSAEVSRLTVVVACHAVLL
jgi:hypothetical protein